MSLPKHYRGARLAGWRRRFVARFIDVVLPLTAALIISVVMLTPSNSSDASHAVNGDESTLSDSGSIFTETSDQTTLQDIASEGAWLVVGFVVLFAVADALLPLLLVELGVLTIDAHEWAVLSVWIVALSIVVVNQTIVQARMGGSVGRIASGIRLVDAQRGTGLSQRQALGHMLMHRIDALTFVGWLLPAFDKRKQTIADKFMDTVAVVDRRNVPAHMSSFSKRRQPVYRQAMRNDAPSWDPYRHEVAATVAPRDPLDRYGDFSKE